MNTKNFFWYVWVAQELTGLIFVSLGVLANYNFIQVYQPEMFVELMTNLTLITVVVNIISFIGVVTTDYEWFKSTDTYGQDDTDANIIFVWAMGILGYFLMIIPIFLWVIIFLVLEWSELVWEKFMIYSGLYWESVVLVFSLVGFFVLLIWFYRKFSSVFEFTIIKRNKKVGENKE